jgi:hypothetical protein
MTSYARTVPASQFLRVIQRCFKELVRLTVNSLIGPFEPKGDQLTCV